MLLLCVAFLAAAGHAVDASLEDNDPILYYYGIEESERGLAECARGQACGVRLARYWRAPAELRLCACARRQPCPAPLPTATVPLDNRAYFQFCEAVSELRACAVDEAALHVHGAEAPSDPDSLEALHHRGVAPPPPRVTLACRCAEPNYWHALGGGRWACGAVRPCRSGALCGEVRGDLLALQQRCACPARHMCVHAGGRATHAVSAPLYAGRGYRAYCRPRDDPGAPDAGGDYDYLFY